MIPEKRLVVAVASDLHAFETVAVDARRPSSLCTKDPDTFAVQHPISGLKHLIDTHTLRADVLVCPGDLAHQADPSATRYAWQQIHALAGILHCKRVVATPGNHDMDSRYKYNDHDPRGFLQSLDPGFPDADATVFDKFWSRHFAVLFEQDVRIITLNSCAYHGHTPPTLPAEHEHGRISQYTLAQLERVLDSTPVTTPNILVCHHHPHPHSELNLGDYDAMARGQELLELLSSGKHGEWLIIHGHKHHPKLVYAHGGNAATLIFSAGSLCADLYQALASNARNQFYLIDLDVTRSVSDGLRGTFRAWDWAHGHGWIPAGPKSGLPAKGGFGFRGTLSALVTQINNILPTDGTMSWSDLVSSIPDLEFLIPSDLDALCHQLKARGVGVERSDSGAVGAVGK